MSDEALPDVLKPEFTRQYGGQIGHRLIDPVSIDSRFYLTEFFPPDVYPNDHDRLLEIAHTPGFVYSGLNNYYDTDTITNPPSLKKVPVEENVRMYLIDEAMPAQRAMVPGRYFAIRDAQAGGQVVGAQEYIYHPARDGQPEQWERASFVAPEYQGQHLASKALVRSVPLAMRELGITDGLMVTIHPDNIASQKVMQKAGFQRTGRRWEAGHVHNDLGSAVVIYPDAREEWVVTQEHLKEHIRALNQNLFPGSPDPFLTDGIAKGGKKRADISTKEGRENSQNHEESKHRWRLAGRGAHGWSGSIEKENTSSGKGGNILG